MKLDNWEQDAIETRLDRLGMAFIEFNEFAEFSEQYDLSWGEPIQETDLEDILEAKLNQSYKDYKLSKSDYFQNCKTMLTSEKAALSKCHQIFEFYMEKKALGSTTKYLDKDFGPMRKSDLDRCKFTLYKNGEPPKKGYADPREVEFAWAEELCAHKGVKP